MPTKPHSRVRRCVFFLLGALLLGWVTSSCKRTPDASSADGKNSNQGGEGALADALREQGVGDGDPLDDDPRPVIAIAYDEAGLPFRAVQGHLVQQILGTREEDYRILPFDSMGSSSRQAEEIKTLGRRKAKVIIVYAFEAAGLAESMGDAQRSGSKILCIGSKGSEALPADVHFIVDQEEIGRLAGEFVVDRLKRKMEMEKGTEISGAVVEITGVDLQGDMSSQRSAGFHSAIAAHPGIHLVHQAPGLWNEGDAASRVLEALHLQPKVDVVYAHNDAMAYAAYLAAREQGRHQGILFVGIDGIGGPIGGIAHVRDQMMGGTIVVPLIIDETVTAALALADGKDPGEVKRVFAPEVVGIANSYEKYREHTAGPEKVLRKYDLEAEKPR